MMHPGRFRFEPGFAFVTDVVAMMNDVGCFHVPYTSKYISNPLIQLKMYNIVLRKECNFDHCTDCELALCRIEQKCSLAIVSEVGCCVEP